jgi:ribosomal protein S18 acetylase RimI-like enzyme
MTLPFEEPNNLIIRRATTSDESDIWAILEPILRAGECYALPRDWTREEAIAFWTGAGREAFVAEEHGQVVGTYYLRANQPGGGSHVANCGYAVSPSAEGRGLGRRLGQHSLEAARARGFRAMQFNFVISTNEPAVHLWKSLGFEVAGTLPGAFAHPTHGDVDALVMYRKL